MFLFGLGNSSQSVLVLGDDKDVDWSSRGDVSKGEDEFILKNNFAWDLLFDQFVKYGLVRHPKMIC